MKILLNLYVAGHYIGVSAASHITRKAIEVVRDLADDCLYALDEFDKAYQARVAGL